jgi:hypothetical protein
MEIGAPLKCGGRVGHDLGLLLDGDFALVDRVGEPRIVRGAAGCSGGGEFDGSTASDY